MPSFVSRSIRTLPLATVMIVGAMLLGGCYYEGGPGFSDDRFVYVSRPWQPITVTLRDTRTGQDFWSCDVPVGRKLILYFQDTEGAANDYTPANMVWGLVEETYELGSPDLENNLPVPPWNARRLDVSYRPVPELPDNMVTATKGSVQPAKVQQVRPPTVTVPAQSRPSGSGGATIDLPPN